MACLVQASVLLVCDGLVRNSNLYEYTMAIIDNYLHSHHK